LAGVTVTPEEHKMFTTFTIPEVARYFHEQYGLASSMEAVMGIMDEYMMSYYERAHLMPGAEAILESCARNNVKMSMASSSKPQFLWAGARATGIADYFSAIVSVEEVGASKREPAVYDRAREAMGTEKAFTWGFEDALYAMDTLVKAGYPVFGLYDEAHGVSQVEVEKRARLVAPTLENVAVREGNLIVG
jgi:beta-phosphoglucomutase-like phosphatase (HAD superfamily)